MMLFNSTVWTCSYTSRPNLTYAEALESEKEARRSLRNFTYELKAPIVYIATLTKRSGIADMVDDIFNYLNVRYFKEEEVFALEKINGKEIWRECEVLNVIAPSGDNSVSPTSAQIEPIKVQYRVKLLDTEKDTKPWIVNGNEIRRRVAHLTKNKLKLFLKQCVECNEDGMLKIKIKMYEKFVTDGGVRKFSDFFVGKPPSFELSKALLNKKKVEKKTKEGDKKSKKVQAKTEKPKNNTAIKSKNNGDTKNNVDSKAKKKIQKDAKQPAISNYFAKNEDGSKKIVEGTTKATNEKVNGKSLAEEMERIRLAKELQEAERKKKLEEDKERQRLALIRVQAAVRNFNQIRDDLELRDQRMLPVAKPVKTLIPSKYFGDALMVLEFLYSYSNRLEDKDKFPKGYSLALIERSLTCREFAGPLSDILQILLGTIFMLQIEEENEITVEYLSKSYFDESKEVFDQHIRDATLAAHYAKTYLAMDFRDLPMDATTISELLRIHLLMSGAKVDENCARWRMQQRYGYRSEDDPGLMLRTKYPHILRALEMHTVYQLPVRDILIILNCLVSQILTYPTIRDTTEERMESSYKAKLAVKAANATERKRELALVNDRKALAEEVKKNVEEFEGSAEDKLKHQEKLLKDMEVKLKHLEYVSDRAKTAYKEFISEKQQDIFSFQSLLGNDRAFRYYWLFESLPGIFIEHRPFGGLCIESPVQNINELAQCAQQERYSCIKQMLANENITNGNDKENKVQNKIEKKKVNGATTTAAVTNDECISIQDDKDNIKKPIVTQRDLLMCTGSSDTCPVHPISDKNRMVWTFLHTPEDLNALIHALNVRGIREKSLKEQLETEKELILSHIKDCPVDELQVEENTKPAKINSIMERKEYANANMKFPIGTDINHIAELTLLDNILELERQITRGHLGSLQIRDRDAWRAALEKCEYDRQTDSLAWGPGKQFTAGSVVVLLILINVINVYRLRSN